MTALGLVRFFADRWNKVLDAWGRFPLVLKRMSLQEGEAWWAYSGMDRRATREQINQTHARARHVLDNGFRAWFGWPTNPRSGIDWVFKDAPSQEYERGDG